MSCNVCTWCPRAWLSNTQTKIQTQTSSNTRCQKVFFQISFRVPDKTDATALLCLVLNYHINIPHSLDRTYIFFFFTCAGQVFLNLSLKVSGWVCVQIHIHPAQHSTLDVCVPSPICALSPFSVVAATMFTGSLIKSMCLTRVWCSSPPADETSSLSKCQSVTGLDTGRQPTPPVADGCILSPKQD